MAKEKDEWQLWWDARTAAVESALGVEMENVLHSVMPFQFGGGADVMRFKLTNQGVAYVTNELIGTESQQANCLGEYELMICHRSADEEWGARIISQLASYTTQAVLQPYDTMDIDTAVPKGSTLASFLFAPYTEFTVRNIKSSLMLCFGITSDELQYVRSHNCEDLINQAQKKSVYPFTDLSRKSILSP